jgi:cytochrome c551/c552
MSLRITSLLMLGALVLGASSAKAQDDAMIKRGKMLWTNRGCNSCHAIGKKMAGPDLAGLQARRSKEWIHRWLKETDVMLASDSTAMGMLAEWKGIKMPKQSFTDQDIDAILAYMSAEEAKMKK